jgi:hypothetical protein
LGKLLRIADPANLFVVVELIGFITNRPGSDSGAVPLQGC